MAVQNPLQLVDGIITEVAAVESSAGSGDEGKIVALNSSGLIDDTMLPSTGAITATASEAIAAGALINIWNSSGTVKVRNADNTSSSKRAHGYAPGAISSGSSGSVVVGEGLITGLTSLTAGSQYFLDTAGGVTTTAPSSTGDIVQSVGVAFSTTELQFIPGDIVVRA